MTKHKLICLIAFFAAAGGNAQAQSRSASPSPLAKPPEISRDIEALPSEVRRMRSLILEAVRSGDLQQLQKPIETNEVPPSFGKTGREANVSATRPSRPAMAAELMRQFAEKSGDGKGRETMGQIINILAVGQARINAGQPQEMYVWPYFAVLDPRLLSPAQEVDVLRTMSAYALTEWREKGRYPGWRLGIGPDGTWHYFHGVQ
ncbi:MAG: hypothetical protein ACRCWF_15700 [Beijerinckiaceae bacterium]